MTWARNCCCSSAASFKTVFYHPTHYVHNMSVVVKTKQPYEKRLRKVLAKGHGIVHAAEQAELI
jgi:3-dehydroquinate synthetase